MKIKIFLSLLGFIFLGISAVAGYFYFLKNIRTPFSPISSARQIFVILPGQGVKEIAENLEKDKIIADDFYFKVYSWLSDTQTRFQAGEYSLGPAMNIPQIVGVLISGHIVSRDIWVTIPEGFSLKEIIARLEEKSFKSVVFPSDISDYQSKYPFLADSPSNANVEGFLFPDTYKFTEKSSSEDIIKKFFDNFQNKLSPDLKEEIRKQNKTIYEIITMASLIEKEISRDPDRAIVSGILWKRISVGMPLQVDATVCYAKSASYKNCYPIYKDDLALDSLYNTYKYTGLPPTPISNPGLAAIKSAIFPQSSDYWFYLSKPNGETVFSRTFEEHNKARALYLK